jgi:hypothetical protein
MENNIDAIRREGFVKLAQAMTNSKVLTKGESTLPSLLMGKGQHMLS